MVEKHLKKKISETHFYALLSMVAGAVIGRRPEKTPNQKGAIHMLCKFFLQSVQVIIGLLRCEKMMVLTCRLACILCGTQSYTASFSPELEFLTCGVS